MVFTKSSLCVCLAIIFASTSVGCGQGFKNSSHGSTAASQSVDISTQMQKAADASLQAQKAMSDADAAVAQLQDQKGNINLSLFQTTSTATTTGTATGVLAPLVNKLNAVFDTLFAKVAMVKSQFASARTLLADAMAKLDPTNPMHASAILQIKEQLAKIDAMELQFRNSMHMLAGKLNMATSAMDKLLNAATSFLPGIGAIAGIFIDIFVMSDVKNLIATVQMRLLAV